MSKDGSEKSEVEGNAQSRGHSGWLTRNIAAVIALIITIGTFVTQGMILFIPFPIAKKEIAFLILGGLQTFLGGVIGYYFGSSSKENGSIGQSKKGKISSKFKKNTPKT